MAQLKITDMFSSQSSQPGGTPNKRVRHSSGESKFTPSTMDAHEVHEGQLLSTRSTPSSQRKSRMETQVSAGPPLGDRIATPPRSSISIPATPDAVLIASQRAALKATNDDHDSDGEQRVPETPRPVTSAPAPIVSLEKRTHVNDHFNLQVFVTPNKQNAFRKGESPFDAIDVSSGADSDCEITCVRPSPKKRGRPKGKKVVSETRIKRSRQTPSAALKKGRLPARSNSEPRRPKSALVTPTAGLHPAASNVVPSSAPEEQNGKHRPSITARLLKHLADADGEHDSDCFVEKVQPSPKRRLVAQRQQSSHKKRCLDVGVAATAPAAVAESTCVKDANRTTAEIFSSLENFAPRSTPDNAGSDADAEDSEMDETPSNRKKLVPQSRIKPKPIKSPVGRRLFAQPSNTVTPSPAPPRAPIEKSPVIDLTEVESSDSSDSDISSDEDTIVRRSEQQNPFIRAQSPSPEERCVEHSNPPTSSKMSILDAKPQIVKREPTPEESDHDVFYTAQEFPQSGQGSPPNTAIVHGGGGPSGVAKQETEFFCSSPYAYDSYEEDGDETSPLRRSAKSTPPTSSPSWAWDDPVVRDKYENIKLEPEFLQDSSSPLH